MVWITVTFGLCLGNFLWQAFGSQSWETAVERSVFQIVAILVIAHVKPWEY